MRERAKRVEMEWGAKHMVTVEGPRTTQGDREKGNLDSDVEQDICTSVDEPRGSISLTDQPVESVDAELVPMETQSQVGEMVFTAGDHQ